MARSQAVALQEGLSPEETAQMDEMRQADTAPQPEETVEQLPAETTEQTEEERTPQGGMVPRSRLNEESERRRQSETRLAEIERQNTLLQERTNLILQSVQAQQRQPEPQAEPMPALDKDPVGFIVGSLQQQGTQLQHLINDYQQRNQQTQQLNNALTLQQRAEALENEYKQKNHEYEPALQHLLAAKHAELALVGVRDPQIRQKILYDEYMAVAQLAMQEGRNPAETIFEIAKGRGYKPGNGVSAQSAQEVIPPPPTAAERVANVAAGQQQSRSLSSVRGAAPVPLTAQRLLEMSNEDFAKAIATPDGRALLG